MPIETQLFFNLTTERFVQSFQQPSDIGNPRWYFGDVKTLRIQFFRNAAEGQGRVEVVSATGISLQLGIAAQPGGTVLTSATADPADSSHTFSVELPLNVSSILTDLGSQLQKQYTLEFRTTDAGLDQRYQGLIFIRNRVLDGAVADPPVGQSALSLESARSFFWPISVPDTEPGKFQEWVSPNGSRFILSIDDNGQIQTTLIS